MEKEETIQVYIRVRPPDSYNSDTTSSTCCVQVTTPTSLTLLAKPEHKVFTFDHVAQPNTTQETVFSTVGRPIIDSCMSGYNGTIFAYGQTGSGKTFTMIGPSEESGGEGFSHQLRGVIPRSLEYLFSLINREKQKFGDLVQFLCKCSFLEIYNEQIYDLLDQASTGLHLRESMKKGVYVDGILEQVVSSATETYQVLTHGWTNRRVAATSMNRESSRSHAVFMLTIESKTKESNNGVSKIRSSTLNLVDLAGSERQKDTQTVGARLKEAGSINRSLSALGNVIMSLVERAHGKSRHVHYRDSKLTFLLRDSLGGNAKTTLIANVHPLARCFGETLSTLQFAKRAKMIKNKAIINEDTTGNVLQLQAEIKKLKELLNTANISVSTVEGGVVSGCGLSSDVQELKEMLSTNIELREKTEKEKITLLERIDKLEEFCKRRDKTIQSTKMILKLRESHIASLEKKGQINYNNNDDVIKRQREEIKQLQLYIDHHPEVTRFATENLELRAEVKRLQEVGVVTSEGSRLHKYMLQLERQLRGCVRENNSTNEIAQANLENERLVKKCQKLQEELNDTLQKMCQQEEEHKVKCFSLETALKIAKKTNHDLEQTLSSLKLQHSLERSFTNDNQLKILQTTPTTSTPSSANKLLVHVQQRRFFTPLISSVRRSFGGGFEEEMKEEEKREEETREEEKREEEKGEEKGEEKRGEKEEGEKVEVAVDAVFVEELMSNLKSLQNTNNDLMEKLESQEVKLATFSSDNDKLLIQLNELKEFYTKELNNSKEEEIKLKKLLTELQSSNDVLKDEVTDLRVCLQSADRELNEIKKDNEKIITSLKNEKDSLSQKVREVEDDIFSKTTEHERILEGLTNLQNELETVREELTFKDHHISEQDDIIATNKCTITKLETKLQDREEEIEEEKRKFTALANEGEGSRKELSLVLNEKSLLVRELEELRLDYQQKLSLKEEELNSLQSSLSSLSCQSSQQSSVITDLTAQIHTLREREMSLMTNLSDIKRETEETREQLATNINIIEKLNEEISSLNSELDKVNASHLKEMKAKDMQSEVLVEEIEFLQSQLYELKSQLENIQKDYESRGEELQQINHTLLVKENELKQLHEINKEKGSIMEQMKSITMDDNITDLFETQTDHLLQLETERGQYVILVNELQEQNKEREEKISELKNQLLVYDEIQKDYELIKTQHLTLQYNMNEKKEQYLKNLQDIEDKLEKEISNCSHLEELISTLTHEKKDMTTKLNDLQLQIPLLKEKLQLSQEQLERVREQEEKTFKEKENLNSQLETAIEEKTRLLKEQQELVKENARLSGHRNLRQRIQFHAELKEKYHKLLEDHRTLEEKYEQLHQHTTSSSSILTDHKNKVTSSSRVLRSNSKQDKENTITE